MLFLCQWNNHIFVYFSFFLQGWGGTNSERKYLQTPTFSLPFLVIGPINWCMDILYASFQVGTRNNCEVFVNDHLLFTPCGKNSASQHTPAHAFSKPALKALHGPLRVTCEAHHYLSVMVSGAGS